MNTGRPVEGAFCDTSVCDVGEFVEVVGYADVLLLISYSYTFACSGKMMWLPYQLPGRLPGV